MTRLSVHGNPIGRPAKQPIPAGAGSPDPAPVADNSDNLSSKEPDQPGSTPRAGTSDTPKHWGGPIRRYTADMLDNWMLGRLEKIWPGQPATIWRGRFLGFQASNEFLPACNDRAVLLASRAQQPMSGQWIVLVWFCWSRDTVEGDWLRTRLSQPVLDLYNHARRWLSDMKGERMILGLCDDLRGDDIVSQWLDWRAVDGVPVIDVRPYKR